MKVNYIGIEYHRWGKFHLLMRSIPAGSDRLRQNDI